MPCLRCTCAEQDFPSGRRTEVPVLGGVDTETSAPARRRPSSAPAARARAPCCTCWAGSTRPAPGRVSNCTGRDLAQALGEARARSSCATEALGFVYQFHHLLMEFSAVENVAMPLLIRRMERARGTDARRAAVLDRVGPRPSPEASSRRAVRRRASARRRGPRLGHATRRVCWPTSRPETSIASPPMPCSACCWNSAANATGGAGAGDPRRRIWRRGPTG
jgi:hypothetical protein